MNKKGQISIVVSLLSVFVVAIVAAVLIPVIGDEVARDINGGVNNFSTADTTILQLWPTFFIIGVLLAILAMVGLS